VADARRPQEVGPPALAIAEVVGVVDDARGVGVLVIDPHRQDVLAALNAAGIGFVAVHGTWVADSKAEVNIPHFPANEAQLKAAPVHRFVLC
jgi:hypothetical protein